MMTVTLRHGRILAFAVASIFVQTWLGPIPQGSPSLPFSSLSSQPFSSPSQNLAGAQVGSAFLYILSLEIAAGDKRFYITVK